MAASVLVRKDGTLLAAARPWWQAQPAQGGLPKRTSDTVTVEGISIHRAPTVCQGLHRVLLVHPYKNLIGTFCCRPTRDEETRDCQERVQKAARVPDVPELTLSPGPWAHRAVEQRALEPARGRLTGAEGQTGPSL